MSETNIFDINSLLKAADASVQQSCKSTHDGEMPTVDSASSSNEQITPHAPEKPKPLALELPDRLKSAEPVAPETTPTEKALPRGSAGGKNRRLSDAVHAVLRESSAQSPAAEAKTGKKKANGRLRTVLKSTESEPAAVIKAIEQVCKNKPNDAFELVLPHVASKNHPIRESAIVGLGKIGDKRSVLPLLRCLLNSRRVDRQLAVTSLGQCDDPRVVRPILSYGILSVIERSLAIESLDAMEARNVVPELAKTASDERDLDLACFALQALGRFKSKRSLKVAVELMQHKEPKLALAAIKTFGGIARPKDAKRLYPVLKDDRRELRLAAVEALGRLKNPDSIAALAALRPDAIHDVELARAVAKSLAPFTDPAATQLLTELVVINDPQIQQQVADHLGELKSTRQEGMVILKDLAKSSNEEVRVRALLAMTRLGDQRSLPVLIQSLDSDSEAVRRQAIVALGKLDSPAAIKELGSRLLSDKNVQVREAAARAIARPGRTEVIRLLQKALGDDSHVRCQVIRSLAIVGGDDVVPIVALGLADAAPDVRVEAIHALVKLDATSETSAIAERLNDHDSIVVAAAEKAMKTLGGLELQIHKAQSLLRSIGSAVMPAGRISAGMVAAIMGVVVLLGGGVYAGWFFMSGGSDAPVIPRGKVAQVDFGPDGTLAVLSTGGWLELWDVDSATVKEDVRDLELRMLDFNDKVVLAATQEKLLELTPGKLQDTQILEKELSDRPKKVVRSGGRSMVIMGKTVGVYDGSEPETVGLGGGVAVDGVVFPDGELMVHAMTSSTVQAFALPGGKFVAKAPLGEGRLSASCLALSPDAELIAVATYQGSISLRSIGEFGNPTVWTMERKPKIRAIEFLPDSQALVVLDASTAVTIWPIATGIPRKLEGFDGEEADSLSVSPDGKYVAVSSREEKSVWILSVEDGSLVKKLKPKPE